jgi:hypothetical protein
VGRGGGGRGLSGGLVLTAGRHELPRQPRARAGRPQRRPARAGAAALGGRGLGAQGAGVLKSRQPRVEAAVLSACDAAVTRFRSPVLDWCRTATPGQDSSHSGGRIRSPAGLCYSAATTVTARATGRTPAPVAAVKKPAPGTRRLAQRKPGARRTEPTSRPRRGVAGARASRAQPPDGRPATAGGPRSRAGRSAARRSAGPRATTGRGPRSRAGRSRSRRR